MSSRDEVLRLFCTNLERLAGKRSRTDLRADLDEQGFERSASTVDSWFQGKAMPNADGIAALCRVFACEPDDLLRSTRFVLTPRDVLAHAGKLGPGAEAMLFAHPHVAFGHLNQRDLVDYAKQTLHCYAGRLTVLYPYPGHGGQPGGQSDEAIPLPEDWGAQDPHAARCLVLKRDPRVADRLRTMMFDPGGSHFVGLDGELLILFVDGAIVAAYRRMRADGETADGAETARTIWMRCPRDEAADIWQRIRGGILQVANPTWSTSRLAAPTVEAAQILCADRAHRDRYAAMRELFASATDDGAIREQIAQRLNNRSPLEIAEIGPGDWTTSRRLLYGHMAPDSYHVTGLEPAPVPGAPPGCVCHKTTLEAYRIGRRRFWLVLCVHSHYQIDPHMLSKSLAILRPGGVLAILHGTRENNVIQLFAESVDEWRGAADRQVRRFWAEDLEAWLDEHDVARDPTEDLVAPLPAAKTVANGELTPTGRKIAQYFLGHDAERIDDWWRAASTLRAALQGLDDQGCITERLILVRRAMPSDERLFARTQAAPGDASDPGSRSPTQTRTSQ